MRPIRLAGVQGAESDGSLDQFVRTHARSLFGTAFVLCGDAHAAEELVQDTLVVLAGRWERVAAADAPLAYVRRAVVHRFVDQRRSPWARVLLLERGPDERSVPSAEARIDDREMLLALLDRLPTRQRAAVVLRYLHDWPDAEIAAALGCRRATVRSLIARALQSLRSHAAAERGELPLGQPRPRSAS